MLHELDIEDDGYFGNITFEDNVEMQFVLSEMLKEIYGLSYQELSELFIKYDAYGFIDDCYWELQEHGLEDVAYEFAAHVCLSGGSMAELQKR